MRQIKGMKALAMFVGMLAAGCASGGKAGDKSAGEPVVTKQEMAEVENLNVPLRNRVTWLSRAEDGTAAFYIFRADNPQFENAEVINKDKPLRARGYAQVPAKYYYYDMDVAAGKVMYYKCQVLNEDGSRAWVFRDPAIISGVPRPIDDEDKRLLAEHGKAFYLESLND